jgi:hypothetical protein
MVTERQVVRRLNDIVEHFLIEDGGADLLKHFDRMMTELNQLREAIAKQDEVPKDTKS